MQASDPVLIKMGEYVDKWKACQDTRYIFLSCYHAMSSNMVAAIDKGEFQDTVWVSKLLHRFADYYFESLTCYDCGTQTPKVWEFAHKVTLDKDLSELQLLILGVNAHINYDLVLALYDLLAPEWSALSKSKQRQRYEDHSHVNRVIAETIDKVQDEILEPLNPTLDWIDKLFGRLDEFLISRLISKWREEVWENTQKLLQMENLAEREQFRKELEEDVLKTGETICFF